MLHNINKKRFSNRSGLTLLELVVVMLVLVALAGILVPLFPNILGRAHGSSGADNINEVTKAVQTHEALYDGQFPNRWDALHDGTDIVNSSTAMTLIDLAGANANIDEDRVAEALTAKGINQIWLHDFTSTNATFETYGAAPASDTVATTPEGEIVVLTGATETSLGLESSDQGLGSAPGTNRINCYVAFGFGSRSNAIGRTVVDVPVHNPENGASPLDEYARFIVIFAVSNQAEAPVRVAGVVAMHDDGSLSGLGAHLDEYYKAAK
jgi:type II secretory pathway pseudopilin PulG